MLTGGTAKAYYSAKPFETIEEHLLDRYPEPASQGYREAMRFLGEYDSLKGQSIDELLQDDASTDEFERFIEGFRLLLLERPFSLPC